MKGNTTRRFSKLQDCTWISEQRGLASFWHEEVSESGVDPNLPGGVARYPAQPCHPEPAPPEMPAGSDFVPGAAGPPAAPRISPFSGRSGTAADRQPPPHEIP